MKNTAILAVLLGGLIGTSGAASAQSGFALKAHYIVNASEAEEARQTRELPHADALGIGAELVLPFGLGIGVSGYTADERSELDVETTELTVLGEANYFITLPVLPISPYVGVHAGMGKLSRENVRDPSLELRDRNRTQLGYQLGVRLQATPLIGIDAQWRRMSTSAAEEQDERLERDQVLIGITLF